MLKNYSNLNHAMLKRLYHKGIAPFRQPHLQSEKVCIRDNYGEITYSFKQCTVPNLGYLKPKIILLFFKMHVLMRTLQIE